MLFKRRTPAALTPPEGLAPRTSTGRASICTGETVIGFLEPKSGKLLQAVVVRTPQDEAEFYRSYGFEPPKKL